MTICPCGTGISYEKCCGRYIEGKQLPQTPETLMRSRYTAYTLANVGYIKNTMMDKALIGFNESEAATWAKQVKWMGLKVIRTYLEHETKGYVEFIASYIDGSKQAKIHEISEFRCYEEKWFYVDGAYPETNSRFSKIGRNDLCPCGSQKKFKNCHGTNS